MIPDTQVERCPPLCDVHNAIPAPYLHPVGSLPTPSSSSFLLVSPPHPPGMQTKRLTPLRRARGKGDSGPGWHAVGSDKLLGAMLAAPSYCQDYLRLPRRCRPGIPPLPPAAPHDEAGPTFSRSLSRQIKPLLAQPSATQSGRRPLRPVRAFLCIHWARELPINISDPAQILREGSCRGLRLARGDVTRWGVFLRPSE